MYKYAGGKEQAAKKVEEAVTKLPFWKNRKFQIGAGIVGLPIGYNVLKAIQKPDPSLDNSRVVQTYANNYLTLSKEYPFMNPLVGALLGGGLGAAYGKLGDEDPLSPMLIGALLGGGLGAFL